MAAEPHPVAAAGPEWASNPLRGLVSAVILSMPAWIIAGLIVWIFLG